MNNYYCNTCKEYAATEADHVLNKAYDRLQSLGPAGLHRGTPIDRGEALDVIRDVQHTHRRSDQP